MVRQRPFLLIGMVGVAFGMIALLNGGLTGFSVYGKLSSIFSGNTLSTMGPSIVIFSIIFGVAIVGLSRLNK